MRSPRSHALFVNEDVPHFVTSVTHERVPIFEDRAAADKLVEELKFYADRHNVELIAYVVMPDHFHAIIYPQTSKHTFSDFMHGVKGYFAKWYGEEQARRGAVTPPIENETGIGGGTIPRQVTPKVWQDSFFDYLILNERKLFEKINYIMENPVEDGLVKKSEDYPYLYINPDYRIE